jgi:hypothetical protein
LNREPWFEAERILMPVRSGVNHNRLIWQRLTARSSSCPAANEHRAYPDSSLAHGWLLDNCTEGQAQSKNVT